MYTLFSDYRTVQLQFATVQDRVSTTDSVTHLVLTGGKLSVPDDRAGAFLNEYANAVARALRGAGPWPAVVELKTPVFRLFVDVDHPDDPDDVVRECVDVVRESFPGGDHEYHVLRNAVSGGLHVVWPQVLVTAPTALRFRERVLQRRPDLAKVVDGCVYRANGLRMPWSIKGRDAPPDAVYRPTNECVTAADIRRVIRATGIRAPGAAPTPTTLETSATTSEASSSGAGAACRVSVDDQFLRGIERCLPSAFGAGHLQTVQQLDSDARDSDVDSDTRTTTRTPVLVIRSSSSVCGNLGFKPHRTNTVYFVVNFRRKTVHQRCYCRCDTTDHRLHGLCKDYASPEYRVPQSVLSLFASSDPPASPLDAVLRRSRRYR